LNKQLNLQPILSSTSTSSTNYNANTLNTNLLWDSVPQLMEEAEESYKLEEKSRQSENYTTPNIFPDIDVNSNANESYKSKKRKYVDTNNGGTAISNSIQATNETTSNTKNLLTMFNTNVQNTLLKRKTLLSVELDYKQINK